MRQNLKKLIAFVCAVAMVITMAPANAEAAKKKVAFVKSYTALYENDTNKGVYTYTVKNLIKGQKVKWSISGTGKSYAKLSKKTTKVSRTTSSNKLTIRTKKKTAAKNKTVIVTAKIYNRNGKLQYTLVAKTAKIKVLPRKKPPENLFFFGAKLVQLMCLLIIVPYPMLILVSILVAMVA